MTQQPKPSSSLKGYTVTFVEPDLDVNDQLVFNCQAEDEDHAKEQCINAYPACVILSAEG